MNFNPLAKQVRPLGGLRKPGAGQVFVTMEQAPAGIIPLMVENINRAQRIVYYLLGEPAPAEKTGMIHEYNLMLLRPDYLEGVYDPPGAFNRRLSTLATIIELTQDAWADLTEFLVDAQGVVMARVRDLLDERTPPEYRETAIAHLQYYADQLTALGAQLSAIAAQLDLAGKLGVEKVRAFKIDFTRARGELLEALEIALDMGVKAAAEAAKALKEPAKWLTVAIVGIAVVALAGAAIYFIPRPRRR